MSKKRQKKGEGPVSKDTIQRYRKAQKLKKFVVKARPLKTIKNVEDRITFCKSLKKWKDTDFLHVVPSDEFMIYSIRKPNKQNDIIWAHSREELDGMDYEGLPRHPTCVGVFLMFSVKKMIWVVKEKGQTWNGEYFREKVLKSHVIPFLTNKENVKSVKQAIFLHDRAPCMKALATQQLLKNNCIKFFDNSEWPGNSSDLNPCENLGSILMEKVDDKLHRRKIKKPATMVELMKIVRSCCKDLENDQNLFNNLLMSFPKRVNDVLNAKGGHTNW